MNGLSSSSPHRHLCIDRSTDPPIHRFTGFTLVELLVVVSIIALLIGILLPALHKARELARAVQCSANVRSTVLAMITYSSDYKGLMTPFRAGGFNWYKILRLYKYSSGTFMCPNGSKISWSDPKRPMGPALTQTPNIWSPNFSVPNSQGFPGQRHEWPTWFMEDRSGMPFGAYKESSVDRTNYMAAATDSSFGSWDTRANGDLQYQEAFPMMYSQLTNASLRKPTMDRAYKPADTAVLWDGAFLFRFQTNFWCLMSLRHHGQTATNFAFMDGHSETRDWTRMPPGIRNFPTGPRQNVDFDPIPYPRTHKPPGNNWQLYDLLNTSRDGNLAEHPAAQHYMRFIVPKVPAIAYDDSPIGD